MVTIYENIKRSWVHLSATPFLSSWLTKENLMTLRQLVAAGEQGHGGEIRVVIEKSLPVMMAWRTTARERALDVFAHYRVWDTVARSGVLIYLNLAEHRLEIVADCGIDQYVSETTWQKLADEAVAKLYEKQPMQALATLIEGVAQQLRLHYGHGHPAAGNELPDDIVVI